MTRKRVRFLNRIKKDVGEFRIHPAVEDSTGCSSWREGFDSVAIASRMCDEKGGFERMQFEVHFFDQNVTIGIDDEYED